MCNYVDNLYDKQCNNNSKHKINKIISLHKVKVEVTASGVDADEDVLPKFLLLRKVHLRLEKVWRHKAPQEAS